MVRSLAHRGPDDEGVETDEQLGVSLGHRRLSIVDLTPLGHQPARSQSGRFEVTYNGEIYNYRELKAELSPSYEFRGTSDTEVLLAAFECWGVEGALSRLDGMFAFVVLDRESKKLLCARDPVGIKPLHIARFHGSLFIASEIKAFTRISDFPTAIDPEAAEEYFRFGFIGGTKSIFRSVEKLLPGALLTISLDTGSFLNESLVRYFFLPQPGSNPLSDVEEVVAGLEVELQRAVARQMVADVPVGAFLSGGIDSSIVTALLQRHASGPVRTYSVRFEIPEFNQAEHAKTIASALGTEHTEFTATEEEAVSVVDAVYRSFDEPFADTSAIPTFLVSRTAKADVTVTLSGDGGDELFGGYSRYRTVRDLWKLREFREGAFADFGVRFFQLAGKAVHAGPSSPVRDALLTRIRSWERQANVRSAPELYSLLMQPSTCFDRFLRRSPGAWHLYPAESHFHPLEWMTRADFDSYLPDDILVKLDRTSMAVSLEARVPLLSIDVIRFVFGLDSAVRFAGEPKELLRGVLSKYIRRELFERPKMGFGAPVHRWARGRLRPWVEALLSEEKLNETEFFNTAEVRKQWHTFLKDSRAWDPMLWTIIAFQAWRCTFESRSRTGHLRVPAG